MNDRDFAITLLLSFSPTTLSFFLSFCVSFFLFSIQILVFIYAFFLFQSSQFYCRCPPSPPLRTRERQKAEERPQRKWYKRLIKVDVRGRNLSFGSGSNRNWQTSFPANACDAQQVAVIHTEIDFPEHFCSYFSLSLSLSLSISPSPSPPPHVFVCDLLSSSPPALWVVGTTC